MVSRSLDRSPAEAGNAVEVIFQSDLCGSSGIVPSGSRTQNFADGQCWTQWQWWWFNIVPYPTILPSIDMPLRPAQDKTRPHHHCTSLLFSLDCIGGQWICAFWGMNMTWSNFSCFFKKMLWLGCMLKSLTWLRFCGSDDAVLVWSCSRRLCGVIEIELRGGRGDTTQAGLHIKKARKGAHIVVAMIDTCGSAGIKPHYSWTGSTITSNCIASKAKGRMNHIYQINRI